MARPPKPTALKKANGNPGRRPLNKSEPKGTAGAPKMPRNLTAAAKEEWKRLLEELQSSGVLTRFDEGIFRLTIEALDDYERTRKIVLEEGYTIIESRQGGCEIEKKHPAVEVMGTAWKRYKEGCTELGATPVARSKVSAVPKEDDSKFSDWQQEKEKRRRARQARKG